MNLYVFKCGDDEYGNGLTDYYHNGGGLVIIAESLAHALGIAISHNECGVFSPRISVGNLENILLEEIPVGEGVHPELWLFPDAGCC